jgi:hypothetical protein
VAGLEQNILLSLGTLLCGMGGSEYQKLSGVMNFPSVVSAETQFHRIEKDILIPAILELQAEVIEEALFELKKRKSIKKS